MRTGTRKAKTPRSDLAARRASRGPVARPDPVVGLCVAGSRRLAALNHIVASSVTPLPIRPCAGCRADPAHRALCSRAFSVERPSEQATWPLAALLACLLETLSEQGRWLAAATHERQQRRTSIKRTSGTEIGHHNYTIERVWLSSTLSKTTSLPIAIPVPIYLTASAHTGHGFSASPLFPY